MFMCHNIIPFFCPAQNFLAARHNDRNRAPCLLKTGADLYLVVMFVDNGWIKIFFRTVNPINIQLKVYISSIYVTVVAIITTTTLVI